MNDETPDIQIISSSGEASPPPDAGGEPAAVKKKRSMPATGESWDSLPGQNEPDCSGCGARKSVSFFGGKAAVTLYTFVLAIRLVL